MYKCSVPFFDVAPVSNIYFYDSGVRINVKDMLQVYVNGVNIDIDDMVMFVKDGVFDGIDR